MNETRAAYSNQPTCLGENVSLIRILYMFLLRSFLENMKEKSPPSARSCLQDTFCQVLKATRALPVGYL